MIEQSLFYIHSAKPTRRFVGCGVLVEGGYIATCRHVWDMATAAAAKADPDELPQVDVEYPRSLRDTVTVRSRARLAHACDDGPGTPPDLVLLLPDEIPDTGISMLRPASHDRFQSGDAYSIAGLVRDKAGAPRVVTISGRIADYEGTDGRREFTDGGRPNAYWFEPGSSGSPIFLGGGEQLAGIVSLSEQGVNEGKSRLREAFVVPATTIRAHVVKLTTVSVARKQDLDLAQLQPVLEAIGAQDLPLAEIPGRLTEFIVAARARADEPVPASNEGADIDAAIGAARAKLGSLDPAGAQAVLHAKIAEIEETHRQRLIPLLEEKAAVEQLSYDHMGAKATLRRLLALDPDRVWSWIALGRLAVITGSLDGAAAAFNAALAAAQRVGDERDESAVLNEIGGVLVDLGNLPEALKSFRKGLAIRDRLAKTDPGNADRQRDLSVSYNNIGDVLVAQGNLPEALRSFHDALAIRDRLAKVDPGNAGWQRDLSASFNRIGDVLVAQGNLPEALKSFRDGFAIAHRLATADPGHAGWQRDLSVSYDRVGDALVAQGNVPEALNSYSDGLAIADRLAKGDPGNAGWQRDLSVSYDRVGNVLVAQGNLPAALKSFRDGLAIRDRLAKADPGNAGWQRDLSVSYNKIGNVLVAQGNRPGALKSFRDGLAIAHRLAKGDPGNAGWQRDLSVSYNKIGDVLKAQGNLPEALKSFHDGLEIADRLANADPGHAGWQRDLSVAYDRIGDVLEAEGNLPEALKSFGDGLAIRDRLAKADPGNAVWQRDLSVSYNKIGDVLVAQGKVPEALRYFRDDLDIADRLAKSDPDNAGWQFDLALSHWKLGVNGDDPANRFGAIVAILRKLEEENRLAPSQAWLLPAAEKRLAELKPP
jgi:tetratricopeptide (TPR) repeat protein